MKKHKFIVSSSHQEFEKLLNRCEKAFHPDKIETHHALAMSGDKLEERFSPRITYRDDL